MAKTYYWLKLNKDFFKGKEIKKLRKIAGGDTYTIIYLKLQLLSLKDEGKLFYDGIEDTFAEELALELDEDVDNISFVLMYLKKCGLVETISDGEILLNQVQQCIGRETDKAKLMRNKRKRDKAFLESGNNDTKVLPSVTFCYTDIDKEKDKDREKELQIDIKESCSSNDFNIFKYLEQRGFIGLSAIVIEQIQADMEIYSIEEVKKAIDISDNNGKHSYSYVKGVLEKRRAGVNEKLDKDKEREKAIQEFLDDIE